jgi:hypothetical protein
LSLFAKHAVTAAEPVTLAAAFAPELGVVLDVELPYVVVELDVVLLVVVFDVLELDDGLPYVEFAAVDPGVTFTSVLLRDGSFAEVAGAGVLDEGMALLSRVDGFAEDDGMVLLDVVLFGVVLLFVVLLFGVVAVTVAELLSVVVLAGSVLRLTSLRDELVDVSTLADGLVLSLPVRARTRVRLVLSDGTGATS